MNKYVISRCYAFVTPDRRKIRAKTRKETDMRHTFIPQLKLGTVPVENIRFDLSSRHELVSILMGLQYLYMHRKERLNEILRLIDLDLVTSGNPNLGCEGMSCWETLVLVSVRLGCDMDYDELADLATNHRKLQQMLLNSVWEDKAYKRSTINDNIRLLTAGTIRSISDVIVELGHEICSEPLKKVRGDTFVLKKNIHYPTDCNLLYDGVRKTIDLCTELSEKLGLQGWREHKNLKRQIKKMRREIERVAGSRSGNRNEKLRPLYFMLMEKAGKIVDKALDTLGVVANLMEENAGFGKMRSHVSEIQYYIAGIEYVSDLARRRIMEGETIPNPEKVFSLFEPDTELINRGKTPYPIEFGHRVLIVQDDAGFIIGTQVLEKGFTDEKIIVEVMRNLQKRYNNRIRAASFDKGFPDSQQSE
jgi:IS5 family transposase